MENKIFNTVANVTWISAFAIIVHKYNFDLSHVGLFLYGTLAIIRIGQQSIKIEKQNKLILELEEYTTGEICEIWEAFTKHVKGGSREVSQENIKKYNLGANDGK